MNTNSRTKRIFAGFARRTSVRRHNSRLSNFKIQVGDTNHDLIPYPKELITCHSVASRDHGAMTKAENRAAARAYHRQKMQDLAREVHQQRVNADLAELGRLLHYLLFKSQSGGPREALLSAIDDYVEALTGDRRALHDHGSSIG
jgi:hypothetical protein